MFLFMATLTFWDGLHSIKRVCISLNKATSYLSLCLSLNYFRTSVNNSSFSKPGMQFQWKDSGLKSQCGFWLSSSPSLWVQVQTWVVQIPLLHTHMYLLLTREWIYSQLLLCLPINSGHLLLGEKERQRSYYTYYLTSADQENSDWLF